MPIHDVGYRHWTGRLTPLATRWLMIAWPGIRIALKTGWVRRVVALAWIPVFFLGGMFFVLEQVLDNIVLPAEAAQVAPGVVDEGQMPIGPGRGFAPPMPLGGAGSPGIPGMGHLTAMAAYDTIGEQMPFFMRGLVQTLEDKRPQTRNEVRWVCWSWMLMWFFRMSQGLAMILLLGIIVPPLISQDVRTRAFLLYYPRPITKMDYLVGKLAIPVFFLLAISTLPAICLYLFGVLGSPDLTVVRDTYDLPFKILLSSVFLIVPTSLLALMLSSLTIETRYAQFAWYTIWGLGAGAWWVFQWIWLVGQETAIDDAWVETAPEQWSILSLYHSLGNIQRWIFDLDKTFGDVMPVVIVLSCLTVLSVVVLIYRISAPVRI